MARLITGLPAASQAPPGLWEYSKKGVEAGMSGILTHHPWVGAGVNFGLWSCSFWENGFRPSHLL